jgi:hypothetical protein
MYDGVIMMGKGKLHAFMEGSVLVLVVAIPLGALVWYAAIQSGLFGPAASVAATQKPSQGLSASAPATVTLDDPLALPHTVNAGDVVPFSFTIKNTGASAATYPYKVYVQWAGGEQDVLDENSVSLEGGASTDISESLKFETSSAKGEVFVEIGQSAERIQFALPAPASSAGG